MKSNGYHSFRRLFIPIEIPETNVNFFLLHVFAQNDNQMKVLKISLIENSSSHSNQSK